MAICKTGVCYLAARSHQFNPSPYIPCLPPYLTLVAEFKAPISAHHRPRTPPCILTTQHGHHTRNLMIIPGPTAALLRRIHILLIVHLGPDLLQWCILDEGFQFRLKVRARRIVHLRGYGARVHAVDRGAVAEFACPGARHGFQCCFGAPVDGLLCEAETGGDGG